MFQEGDVVLAVGEESVLHRSLDWVKSRILGKPGVWVYVCVWYVCVWYVCVWYVCVWYVCVCERCACTCGFTQLQLHVEESVDAQ